MTHLLEIDTSTPGGIMMLIFGIICIPIIFYLISLFFGYFLGGMAKLSNKRIVKHGRTVADPDTIDNLNADVKEKFLAAKKGVTQASDYVKKQITDQKGKKFITKIQEIEKLKQNGNISEEEYLNIRAEILKKHYS